MSGLPSIGDAERGQGREGGVYFRWQREQHFWQMLVGVGVALLRLECRLTCLTTSITLMDLIFPEIRMKRRESEFLLKWKRAIESKPVHDLHVGRGGNKRSWLNVRKDQKKLIQLMQSSG